MAMDPRDQPQREATSVAAGALGECPRAATIGTPAKAPTFAGAHAADPALDAWLARRRRMRALQDRVLVALVLLLAFVLASVPIRNSDAWLHLAAGRDFVGGAIPGGADPFTYSKGATGSTWLFDVLCYSIYTVAGGTGLCIALALAVTLLAAIIVRAGRRVGAGWAAATCTTLALLAMLPWLRLQPLLCSLLFLATTIAYLERRTALRNAGPNPARGATWWSFWPLYLLFVVWSNCDPWFLIGLVVLVCYWLGGLIRVGQAARARVPLLPLLAAGAVCLLNPRGYHALDVPADLLLRLAHPALAADAAFRSQFLSPLLPEFLATTAGWRAAHASIALLLVLGAFTAVINRTGRQLARLLVCALLLGLGLLQARHIPFLAVALAIYVQRAWDEIAARRAHDPLADALRLRQVVTGQLATIVAGFVLLTLGALGWFQPGTPQPRGWALLADPSLVRAAEELAAWHRDGRLPVHAVGLSYSPEVADYCAWFCPDEQGLVNSRLDTCIEAAPDFALVRQGLFEPGLRTIDPARMAARPVDWRAVLRRRQVDHVVLADRDRERMQAVLYHVLAAPEEWQVLLQAGRVLVLAWHDPRSRAAAGRPPSTLDLGRDGVDAVDAQRAPDSPAPPITASWLQSLLPAAVEPSLDRDEAQLRMMAFEALRAPTARRETRVWQYFLAGCATGQVVGGDAPGAALRMLWLQQSMAIPPGSAGETAVPSFSEQLRAGFLLQRDEAPVGQLLAAVRACRRALAAQPADADAQLLLGQLYCRLAWQTAERVWVKQSPALAELRLLQAVNALQQALAINPELAQAHGLLVSLYQQARSLERALRHLRSFQNLQRKRGPIAGETTSQYADRLDRLGAEVLHLERQVFQRESDLERLPPGWGLSQRARVMNQLGLADQALQLLLDADATTSGTDELYVAMELLLSDGRAAEAAAQLKTEHQALFGEFDYHWLSARLALATGDYAGAEAHLAKLVVRPTTAPELQSAQVDLEVALALAVARHMLATLRQAMSLPSLPSAFTIVEPLRVQQLQRTLAQAADFSVIHGVAALEHGTGNRALRLFRNAARLSGHDPVHGTYPIANYYVQLLAPSRLAERPAAPGVVDP